MIDRQKDAQYWQQQVQNYLQEVNKSKQKFAEVEQQKRKYEELCQQAQNLQECIQGYQQTYQDIKQLQKNLTQILPRLRSGELPQVLPFVKRKSNKTIKQAREHILQDIPKDIWSRCWNDEQKCFDFTQPTWTELPYEKQVEHAKNYQRWYAHTYNKELTIIKYCDEDKKQQVPFTFKFIPPGIFWMGSPKNEHQRISNEKKHKVWISKFFWIAETLTTQKQWQLLTGSNPSHFNDCPNNPVECISWKDCKAVTKKIAFLQLPSEAQWEYVCRAGSTTTFNLGKSIASNFVNCNGNYPYEDNKVIYREQTTAVKELANQNAWECYDFHGNVWEWCIDNYAKYPMGDSIYVLRDPVGSDSNSRRVLRGGSWDLHAQYCRSAYRGRYNPTYAGSYIGVRFILNPPF